MKEKSRYRVQVQFDVLADNDLEAVETIYNNISNMKKTNNKSVIYFAEQPYAMIKPRVLHYSSLVRKSWKKIVDKIF
tara:strand:- start:1857 stop:2087 length:231 start_codon:yes stop_codon:yes gene_type:complete